MPTLWTQTLAPTGRQVPAEAQVPSHQLMLRAGLIRQLGAGVYDYLPLGWRSLFKAMMIIRQEMNATGAVEVLLPSLQPIELWEQTGRRAAYGENLFVVKDRHGRVQALGPTHEEVITELVGGYVQSHAQLPLCLYQIQTKFRDEFRPRFGVLRSREFQMKDAYSFHLTLEGDGGLDAMYQKQFDAYCRIFERCGLPYRVVEAESGPIGGSASHEFMVPSPTGEDTILVSDKGNYAANVEKCEIGPRPVGESFRPCIESGGQDATSVSEFVPAQEPKGAIEKIHTPDCASIEDVTTFFKKSLGTKLKTSNMLKTLVFEVYHITDAQITAPVTRMRQAGTLIASTGAFLIETVVVVVRGDHEVNESKLRKVLAQSGSHDFQLRLTDVGRAKSGGFAVGFVGPNAVLGKAENVVVIIDPDAAIDQFWVTGANEVDHHVKHFHWKRDLLDHIDPKRVMVADIRNAAAGDPSPKNDGGVLQEQKGIEIGHVFKLGTKYTQALDVKVLNEKNERVAMLMGCYGIGVNRILASAIEREGGHDDNGIIWPASIAPYQVCITTIRYEGQARDVALKLAGQLEQRASKTGGAVDVIIDNRDERPGVKFKDADLLGFPVRITIGDKALATGQVEIKARDGSNGDKGELVAIDAAVDHVVAMLEKL